MCVFQGKVRQPLSVQLTPRGHEALVEGMTRTGLGRNDYVEHLLRLAASSAHIPSPEETDGLRPSAVSA